MLQPDRCVPTFIIDLLLGPNQDPLLERLLDVKTTLAQAIADKVRPVLTDQTASPDSLDEAKERLRQELLVSLGNAYATDVIVQFEAEVTSVFEGPGAPRAYVVPMPGTNGSQSDFSVTPGKLSLAASNASNPVYLTLLVRATGELNRPYVRLGSRYLITQIEHELRSVPGIEDYTASSWLKLLRPRVDDGVATLTMSDADSIRTPIPLRSYPAQPVLATHEASPSNLGTIDLAEVASWTYRVTFATLEHLPQDEFATRISFNERSDSTAFADQDADLVHHLAQFIHTEAEIEADLQEFLRNVDSGSGADHPEVKGGAAAIGAFADIAERVATAWAEWEVADARSAPADSIDIGIVETVSDGHADRFEVRIRDWPASETVTPTVEIPGWRAEPAADNATRFVYVSPDSPEQYLTPEIARRIPERLPVIERISAFARQNANTGLSIIRNAYLLPDRPSADAFVYRTPEAEFGEPLMPALLCAYPIDIAAQQVTNAAGSLAAQIEAALRRLYGDASFDARQIQLEAGYRYRLNDSLGPVVIPVMYAPHSGGEAPADDDVAAFAARVAVTISAWRVAVDPATANAKLMFDLTVFSNAELTGATQPLIRLPQLYLRIDDIEDWH